MGGLSEGTRGNGTLPLIQLEALLSRVPDPKLRQQLLEVVRAQDRALFKEQLAWQKATQRARTAESTVFELSCKLRESLADNVALREKLRQSQKTGSNSSTPHKNAVGS